MRIPPSYQPFGLSASYGNPDPSTSFARGLGNALAMPAQGDPAYAPQPWQENALIFGGQKQDSPAAIDIAGNALGLNENDKATALDDYLKTGGQNLDPATTAWCAAFVNATLKQSGQEGTNSLAARSFLEWGQPVDSPQRGDVAVFSRGDPNGWQGHVGFYDRTNPDGTVRILGGNQGDSVSYADFPTNSLLGYRRG